MKTFSAPQGISDEARAVLFDAGWRHVEDDHPDMEWVRVKEPATDAKIIASPSTGRTHLQNVVEDINSGKRRLFDLADIDYGLLKTIRSTSEVAIGLLINIMRFNANRNQQRPGQRIQGKRFACTGKGRVSGHITEVMQAMKSQPYHITKADIIFISEKYEGDKSRLFDRNWKWPCNDGVFVVNTSRSELVDRDVLISHIKNGHIAGYAEDITGEPMPAGFFYACALAGASFAFTNHLGGYAVESLAEVEMWLAQEIVRQLA